MKQVLITGANRGIGFAFVKQLQKKGFTVIATCRTPEKADDLQKFSQDNPNVIIKKLDVTKDEQISALANELENTKIDWLINNAGISGESGVTIGNIQRDNFFKVLDINVISPLKVSEAFLPALKKSKEKLIICISSRMGSISNNDRGRSYAYRTSKAALNCVMRSFALDVENENIKVLLLHPGWVHTDMGGNDALLSPDASVTSMLNVIEKHKTDSHAEALWSYDGTKINW